MKMKKKNMHACKREKKKKKHACMHASEAVGGLGRGLGKAVRSRGRRSALIYVHRDVCYDLGARGGGGGVGRWLWHHQSKLS